MSAVSSPGAFPEKLSNLPLSIWGQLPEKLLDWPLEIELEPSSLALAIEISAFLSDIGVSSLPESPVKEPYTRKKLFNKAPGYFF